MKKLIEIPKPCDADWSAMKISDKSRFCDSCVKNVVDFTLYNKLEIIEFMMLNQQKKVCGHFRFDQLDFEYQEVEELSQKLQYKYRHTSMAFFVLAFTTALLLSCENKPSEIKENKPKKEVEQVSMTTLGNPSPIIEPTEKATKKRDETETVYYDGASELTGDVTGYIVQPPPVEHLQLKEHEVPLPIEDSNSIYTTPEVSAEFVGGMKALRKYIADNLVMPSCVIEDFEGKIYVRFVVAKTGEAIKPEIMRSFEGAEELNKEVKRLILSMPKWIPAKNNGKNVSSYFNLPVKIDLK